MKILILFFLVCLTVCTNATDLDSEFISRGNIESLSADHVKFINSLNTTWTARQNFKGYNIEDLRRTLLGTFLEFEEGDENLFANLTSRKISKLSSSPTYANLPENFDSREQWPECADVISHVRDQGSCGSCWAVATATAITDRVCVASGGKNKTHLSAQQITSCCTDCFQTEGCQGGWPIEAWLYWVRQGLFTGGDYGDKTTCEPYLIEPCEHHVDGPRKKCDKIEPTPKCSSKCSNEGVSDEKNYGKMAFRSGNSVGEIKTELFKRGPMTASFVVYDDFFNYKDGVYQVTRGARPLGGHAISVIGWGKEDGLTYWLCKNNWNFDWGMNGFFKIKMGEASINQGFCSGIARGRK